MVIGKEDRRSAIETMKTNPNSCGADYHMVGDAYSGVKPENKNEMVIVHTTMHSNYFQSYIRATLTNGLFANETKNSHFWHIRKYVLFEYLA